MTIPLSLVFGLETVVTGQSPLGNTPHRSRTASSLGKSRMSSFLWCALLFPSLLIPSLLVLCSIRLLLCADCHGGQSKDAGWRWRPWRAKLREQQSQRGCSPCPQCRGDSAEQSSMAVQQCWRAALLLHANKNERAQQSRTEHSWPPLS